MLDVVFVLDRQPNVIESFKIDQALQSMPLCKAINESGPVFENATDEVVRHPDIQDAVRAIGQNVNVATCDHRSIMKDVDGRDKPGHDGEASA
jgi:hypothetical protein